MFSRTLHSSYVASSKMPMGNPERLNLLDAAILPEQRLRLSGIGDAQLAASLLPGGKTNRHVAAFDAPHANKLIELAQKFRGLKLVRREAAQDSCGDRAIERGGAAFSADVSQRDAQLFRAVGKKIVQIAADFAGGKNSRGDVQAKIDRRHGTQQARFAGAARR